ncbi:MAG: D-2-hydroxyacid dehydrogenase [Oceanospirillaceae bacterium]|nr:D-2-hydroxyacid dehydrogenase [Oceanospirillaceae bacterium]
MENIVFLDRCTFGPSVELHRPGFAHEWGQYDRTVASEVADRLAGATIAITNKVPISAETLADSRLAGLKMISVAATGYDVVDVAACRDRGIAVYNVKGYAVNTVPEHTFGLILALRRQLIGYRNDVLDGRWQASKSFCFFSHEIRDLSDSTLGLIGAGAIGQRVGEIARAFGMKVLIAAHKGIEPQAGETEFNQVLQESDVISLHCPLNDATRNLISSAEFERMCRRPLIINTARGGIVNEPDLVVALEQGKISGIGFDCLSVEPPADDHPLLRIADRPDVLITPHVSWSSQEAMATVWSEVIQNMQRFFEGDNTNRVS